MKRPTFFASNVGMKLLFFFSFVFFFSETIYIGLGRTLISGKPLFVKQQCRCTPSAF